MRAHQGRISVLALMIMIAAAAPGIALARALPAYVTIERWTMVVEYLSKSGTGSNQSGMGWRFGGIGNAVGSAGTPFERRPSYWLAHVPPWSAPSLLSCTLVATILGLRGRRAGLRRLAGRPGIAAGFAVLLALAVATVDFLRLLVIRGAAIQYSKDGWGYALADALDAFVRLAGLCVASWWLALALSGRWRPEADAWGKVGRALGWCWIAAAASREAGEWCFALNR